MNDLIDISINTNRMEESIKAWLQRECKQHIKDIGIENAAEVLRMAPSKVDRLQWLQDWSLPLTFRVATNLKLPVICELYSILNDSDKSRRLQRACLKKLERLDPENAAQLLSTSVEMIEQIKQTKWTLEKSLVLAHQLMLTAEIHEIMET